MRKISIIASFSLIICFLTATAFGLVPEAFWLFIDGQISIMYIQDFLTGGIVGMMFGMILLIFVMLSMAPRNELFWRLHAISKKIAQDVPNLGIHGSEFYRIIRELDE